MHFRLRKFRVRSVRNLRGVTSIARIVGPPHQLDDDHVPSIRRASSGPARRDMAHRISMAPSAWAMTPRGSPGIAAARQPPRRQSDLDRHAADFR
jgi:hypothetical protein